MQDIYFAFQGNSIYYRPAKCDGACLWKQPPAGLSKDSPLYCNISN